jgi:hypothetical protein
MKKLYTMVAAILTATAITAQVNVTYNVDITDYLAGGTALGANGIRIGGNFGDTGGMLTDGTTSVANWSPSDATCAMTNVTGTNIWTITVRYFTTPVPPTTTTQQYKFVNNDWGTNEGLTGSTIATDGCGTDDGGGNINRTLDIPATGDVTLNFCWDKCAPCDGVGFQLVNAVSEFSIFPNPAQDNANISFNVAEASKVSVEIYNALGQRVNVSNLGEMLPGNYKHNVSTDNLVKGIYFVKLTTGSKSETKALSIVK